MTESRYLKTFEKSRLHQYCVARMENKRGAYRVLVGKPEGKRPLGKPRHR
jgi:hypothetical protein